MNGAGARAVSTVVRVALAAIVAALAVVAPAGAQGGEREPTADHLWEAYPLDDGSPPPEPTASTTAEPRRGAGAPPGRREPDGDGRGAWLAAALLGGCGIVAAAVVLRRRRSRDPASPDGADGRPRAALGRSRVPRNPRLRLAAWAPAMSSSGRFRRAPTPPEPSLAWEAEIRWQERQGSGRFCAVAIAAAGGDEAVLLRSESIPWPPRRGDATALREAVDAITAELIDAGWDLMARGDAWYARQFAWEPTAPWREAGAPLGEPEPEPARLAVRPAAGPTPAVAPVARPDARHETARWSDDEVPEPAADLWRCRIRWRSGWRSSRFEAMAMPPGKKRGPCVAATADFKWTLKTDPDPAAPEVRAALIALHQELRSAGWQPSGIGRQWYAREFAWHHAGPPPGAVPEAEPEPEAEPADLTERGERDGTG